jgi:hypothetical protein
MIVANELFDEEPLTSGSEEPLTLTASFGTVLTFGATLTFGRELDTLGSGSIAVLGSDGNAIKTVLGAKASSGTIVGSNGYIPQARKPEKPVFKNNFQLNL